MWHPQQSSRGRSTFANQRSSREEHTQSSQSDRGVVFTPGTPGIPGRRQGHPPGLRGKAIGLYYRDRNREKKANAKVPVLKLPSYLIQRIKTILNLSNSDNSASEPNERSENDTKYNYISDSQFKQKFLGIVNGNIQRNIATAMSMESKLQRNSHLDKVLQAEYNDKQNKLSYKNMLKFRLKLPAYQKKSEILQLIQDNQVVVVSGETGCGKTTQVAQFILDEQLKAGNGSITRIVCTQPRRISAISVAERVAAERAEPLGKSVGYQIRLEKVAAQEQGSILFCTTGILLQLMKTDPALRNFSHVILDEIHERSTESDFIITLLKQVIPKRTDLKVLLMSATLNSERFSTYYDRCPVIHIPGFTYPVKEFYLEDILLFTGFTFSEEEVTGHKKHLKRYKELRVKQDDFMGMIKPYIRQLISERIYPKYVTDELAKPSSEELSLKLIEKLVRHICLTKDPGAILIFLPGMMDILQLNRMMVESGYYPSSKHVIYPLHSRMPTVDQAIIFKEPPYGIRKIIIATSIAETSITIEDVIYVINCGKTKLGRFDIHNNIQTLESEWVSLASAKQRRGRAGRVQSGECYHLYSKAREKTFDQYPLPEMLRTRLEEVILQIKILQLGKAKEFLANVMDPPDLKAIDLSLDLLRTLNALDNDEHLTPLGYHLAHLPLDPRTGKMILWAALFSCAEPIFAIAASLTFKDAFYCPLDREEEANEKKLELSLGQYSDHMALAEALQRFEMAYQHGVAGRFCREYFLSYNTLKLLSEMKTDFAKYLYEMKFLDSSNPNNMNANRNSHNMALIKAIVCAGLYPNIAVVRRTTKNGVICWTPEDGTVHMHPSSVNSRSSNFPSRYLTYFTKQRSTAIFLHDTTCVSIPILLFARPNMSIRREKRKCTINFIFSDNIACDPDTAEVIQKLHEALNTLLEYKVTHPTTVCWSSFEGQLLRAIIELVSQKDEEIGFGNNAVDDESMDDFCANYG
ncbi:ATP-dependent RNA helicase DHX36 [Harpegnathos saltator]|uniref:RNA helicase n=1 Tax=Harpegnathos saltator TaxID=610380 RepID=E2BMJ4_HARSA|nr:ATP-dependent RNA helicase DHX36 [Harpegnathos saltator]EFN83103.1 Probable ATP-dependent RNA helicase DHX36 [Harpegnathos saltator]